MITPDRSEGGRSHRFRPAGVAAILAGGLLLAMAAGCAPRSGAQFSESFDPAETRSVAVGEFTVATVDSQRRDEARRVVTRAFEQNLVELGYRVVERRRLEQVIAEQERQWSELTSDEKRAKVGEILNADALLLGSVYRYRDDPSTGDLQVLLTAELVDVETGEVLWTDERGVGTQGGGPRPFPEWLEEVSREVANTDGAQVKPDSAWTREMAGAIQTVNRGNSLAATTMNLVEEMTRRMPLAAP